MSEKPTYEELEKRIIELEKAEEVLKESETFLNLSQTISGIGSYITDLKTGIWRISEEMYSILGIDKSYPHTLEGFLAIVHPDSLEDFLAYHHKVENERLPFDYEYKIIRVNDKAVRWVHGLGSIEYDERLNPVRRVGTIQDITERKQAEWALQESELRYQQMTNQIPGMLYQFVIHKDGSYSIPYVSEKIFDYSGIKPEQVLTDPSLFFQSIHPDDLHYIQDQILQSAKDLSEFSIEHRLITHSGERKWFKVKSIPKRLENGDTFWNGISIDITKRKKAERDLQTQAENLITIFNSVPTVLVLVNEQGQAEMINDKGAAFAEQEKENLIGLLGGDILNCLQSFTSEGCGRTPECDNCPVRTRVESTFETGKPHIEEEGELTLRREGQRYTVTLLITTMSLNLDGTTKVLLSLTDITERKKADARLRQSEERLNLAEKIGKLGNWEYNISDNTIVWSEHAYDLFELNPESGPPTFDEEATYYSKKTLKILRRYSEKVIETGEPIENYEFTVNLASGRNPIFIGSMFPIKDTMGRVVKLFGTFQDITERKRIEEELKLSEECYRLLFDESINPIVIYNQSAEFVMINQVGANNFSRPVNEIIGKPLSDFLPEMHDLTVRRIAETLESNKGLHFEDEILLDDTKRSFLSIFQPVHGLIHDNDTVQVVSYDITKRKQAENALLESEQRWKNILINTPQIGISLDLQGKIIFANNHFFELTGWNEEGVLGQDWFNMFIPEAIREKVREVFQTTLQDSKSFDFSAYENDIVTRSGDMRSIAWSNVLSRNTEGEILDVTCLGIDITERNQAANALAKQKNLFETMFNTIPDGVVVTNTNREIQLANKGMTSTFGYNPKELLGKSTEILYADKNRFEHTGATVFEQKASKKEDLYVTSYKNKTGKEFPGETFGAKLFDEKGKWLGNLGIMRDISDRIKQEEERIMLQQQLQQAQKLEAIGTLAGGIAHDFNNILGAIIGYAEMILDDCPAESTTAHDIQQVITAGHRAKELVKQILAFSRQVETEKIPLQPAIIVKEVIKLLRSSMPATISIEQNIDQNVGIILADPNQIHQIIMNICTNAFHAMEVKGGCLTITLQNKVHFDENFSNPRTFVELSIRDTGEGIRPGALERIFEPYFTTKEVGKGTGMGLAIVHGIVQSYGGSIVCESRIGEGTVFQVSLPALQDHSLREKKPVEQISGGKERILFVDDEKMLLEMGGTILERLGYRVSAIGNSAEALAAFQNEPDKFDLVISDQTMPGMTGVDLSRRILQIRPEIPIILCTGYSSLISEEKARSMGIKAFIMKPLSKQELAGAIRTLLDSNSDMD